MTLFHLSISNPYLGTHPYQVTTIYKLFSFHLAQIRKKKVLSIHDRKCIVEIRGNVSI